MIQKFLFKIHFDSLDETASARLVHFLKQEKRIAAGDINIVAVFQLVRNFSGSRYNPFLLFPVASGPIHKYLFDVRSSK